MAERRFRVGDVVRFQFGIYSEQGVVKEDRGPIGRKGRRLYLIEFKREPDYTSQIELPADDLEAVPSTASPQ